MIKLQAILGSVRQTKDGGVGFSVHTQEISNEEKLAMLNQAGSFGWFCWKEDEKMIDDSEIPKENTDIESKSYSQRLRAVMFLAWKNNYSEKYPIFDEWRAKQMEGLIQQYKDKIDQY